MISNFIHQFVIHPQDFANKAFIHGFAAIVASLLPCMESAIAEPQKTTSAQSGIAGTWQLTIPKPQAYMVKPMPPLSIIITEEGRIYAKDPQHENEYIEVGVIRKTSENMSLPANAKITNPYASPNRARQSEGKAYTGTMNRAQQGVFVERAAWSNDIQGLETGIKPESENYRYSIKIDPTIITLKTNSYPGIAINMGIAKRSDLKSYVGIAYVRRSYIPKDIESIFPYAVLCESNQPTMKMPSSPRWNGKEMMCPEGYTAINR